jgi:hypothetical protein
VGLFHSLFRSASALPRLRRRQEGIGVDYASPFVFKIRNWGRLRVGQSRWTARRLSDLSIINVVSNSATKAPVRPSALARGSIIVIGKSLYRVNGPDFVVSRLDRLIAAIVDLTDAVQQDHVKIAKFSKRARLSRQRSVQRSVLLRFTSWRSTDILSRRCRSTRLSTARIFKHDIINFTDFAK